MSLRHGSKMAGLLLTRKNVQSGGPDVGTRTIRRRLSLDVIVKEQVLEICKKQKV